MKIRVEKCEVITVVRIDGDISPRDVQILNAGVSKLAEGAKILLISFLESNHGETIFPDLKKFKEKISSIAGLQFGIISPMEGFGDFDTIEKATARIPGPLGKMMAEKFALDNIRNEFIGKIGIFEKKLKSYEEQKLTLEKLATDNTTLALEKELLISAAFALVRRLQAQQEPVYTEEELKNIPTLKEIEKGLKEMSTILYQKGYGNHDGSGVQ